MRMWPSRRLPGRVREFDGGSVSGAARVSVAETADSIRHSDRHGASRREGDGPGIWDRAMTLRRACPAPGANEAFPTVVRRSAQL